MEFHCHKCHTGKNLIICELCMKMCICQMCDYSSDLLRWFEISEEEDIYICQRCVKRKGRQSSSESPT